MLLSVIQTIQSITFHLMTGSIASFSHLCCSAATLRLSAGTGAECAQAAELCTSVSQLTERVASAFDERHYGSTEAAIVLNQIRVDRKQRSSRNAQPARTEARRQKFTSTMEELDGASVEQADGPFHQLLFFHGRCVEFFHG